MKRIMIVMAIMMTIYGAKAQVSSNVRVGIGIDDGGVAASYLVQTNIPLKKGSWFTFSPSLEYDLGFKERSNSYYYRYDCKTKNLLVPLRFGYKTYLGSNILFFPKIGPAVGIDMGADGDRFNVGPTAEMALEYKHVVVAVGGYYSIKDVSACSYHDDAKTKVYNFSLTVGYKF